MKFGSLEYVGEVRERSNSDEEYLRLARGENESYTMRILAEPEKGVPEDITAGYQLEDGRITDVWEGERETDFTLSARYGVWVDILTGRLNAVKALSLRRLKIKGSFLKLLKSRSTERWVEVLMSIPTEFEGDYAREGTPGRDL